jgi:dolichol-phosphate mannosyltransferase
MDAITSFSYKPLRLSFGLFAFSCCISALLMLSMLVSVTPVATAALGVASAVFFVGGMLLLSLGLLGEYVGRVYDEVRNRPLSLINQVHRPEVQIATQAGMIAVQTGSFALRSDKFPEQDATRAA